LHADEERDVQSGTKLAVPDAQSGAVVEGNTRDVLVL